MLEQVDAVFENGAETLDNAGTTPTPYTLHPTPYTLHPTPYTLHPTPYNLRPTPYTIHHTPYNSGATLQGCFTYKEPPPLGPCGNPMPRVLGGSQGGGCFL